ncbi:carboxypeptidase-like regulatory domain-containing protein [Carboxylicivirga sp. N1Y90]|uniref:carboxypeptidase-like regulatory domain-containing protein n=1 Tax=Carboxylicivirga fragile TaxID=3417571 RepID=UPI003D34EA25|nr:carboxypeptidase-like regulatory domain-containing protein [Marinilabiliaceae bacterium N1Y90]
MNLISRLVYLTIILFAFQANSQAQELINSRRTSHHRYIYSINQEQAKEIHTKGLESVNQSYFHNLVDSITLDSAFVKKLPQGDYLSVWADDSNLHYQFRSYSDIDLILHNNYADLSFSLRNKEGELITNADVRFQNRRISFDKKTQCYFLPKKQIKGLIEVEHQGFTSFFYIDNIAGKVSLTRKILYSFPLKYITVPVKLILLLPYDIYRSIRYHGIYGLPYYISKPFKDIYHSIDNGYPQGFVDKLANRFDRERKWDYGYTVYSKPKYRPSDSVKVKTYIANKKGKPYNKPLNVYYHDKTYKLLGQAIHSNKGNYHYSFAIHDSLNLKLDTRVQIYFGPNPWTHLSSSSFYYEDYELKGIKYSFRCEGNDHFPGDTIQLFAKGEDMNGYVIPDGKVQIIVKPGNQQSQYQKRLTHLPDTAWNKTISLEGKGETTINIPDTIFKAINSNYNIEAIFTNASNERTVKRASFNYWYKKEELRTQKLSDSIKIEYLNLNQSQSRSAYIEQKDINNNVLKAHWVELPYQQKIHARISHYTITSQDLQQDFYLKDHLPNLGFNINRNHETIEITSINPDQIPFKYHLYKKSRKLARQQSTNLDTTITAKNKANYFLSVQYEWAGESHSLNYTIPLLTKQLNLEVEQVNRIYPGQSVEFKIKATDYKGQAVSNVDLTAMGLTKKFKYTPPSVPNFEKKKKERAMRNDYVNNGNALFGELGSDSLDYDIWNSIMQLDTIEFFKFSHPKNGLYQTQWKANNEQTQLAPFVFKKGVLQQAHIIWIDNSIVYASISNNNPPYSFKCQEGYHSISIRTKEYDIVLDSILVKANKKNIVSIDIEHNVKAKIKYMKNEFSSNEKRLLRTAFVRFNPKGRHLSYTRQFDQYNILNSNGNYGYRGYITAGPFHQLGNLNYTSDRTWTFSYEPYYMYSINGDALKMKTDEAIVNITNKLLINDASLPQLTDETWTQQKINELITQRKNKSIAQSVYFSNPWSTSKGNTSLRLDYKQQKREDILLYTLLFNDASESVRIYNNNQSIFHDLEQGNYRLMMVYSNHHCYEVKNIELKKGGRHFLQVREPKFLSTNIDLKYLTQLISQKRIIAKKGHNTEHKIKKSIINNLSQNTRFEQEISGYIYDDADGLPIPGANVFLKGTSHGTISNIDGYYKLKVPAGTPEICFSFIGYKSINMNVGMGNHSDIRLNADECNVDEVVVVGYGTSKKYSLTGSVTTVQSALQGQVAGISIVNSMGAPGASHQVRIRGLSSIEADKQPLYIIDGVPYQGDLKDIDANSIAEVQILKETSAAALYGARAANGAVILTLKDNTVIPFKRVTIEKSIPLLLPTNNKGLRTNFKDEAYWQPALLSDKNGEASFKVTFPDDITSWDTHLLAMSPNGLSAKWSGNIKAFLPLSANLVVPRFAVEGDSINIIGKTINYLGDSIKTKHRFYQEDSLMSETKRWTKQLAIDTMSVSIPKVDTLSLKYELSTETFKDGENRDIPIIPIGSIDNIGEFTVLQSDTSITWNVNNGLDAELYIESNPLNILYRETKRLRHYAYLCNEQKASKLIGLLAEKQICDALDKKFKYEKDIKSLIKKLNKSKNSEDLWGWWSGNTTSYWVSHHVIKALSLAKVQGYDITMDEQTLARHLVSRLQSTYSLHNKVELLNTLIQVDSISNYTSHTDDLVQKCHTFNDSILVYSLRQKMGYKDDITALVNKHKTTLYGSVYWGNKGYWLFSNDLMQTLQMYQLIKQSGRYRDMLPKIRNWFFEQRDNSGWINTYQASNIIRGLLPELISLKDKSENNSITVSWDGGSENIQELPFQKSIANSDYITITKKGKQTVFAGYHQKVFNPKPEPKTDYFVLNTAWQHNSESVKQLEAGKKYQLEVSIEVKNKSDYLMLEIPIPAGCSYANKKSHAHNEAHREYYKEKVNIYFRSLEPGTYIKTIELVPRFNGKFNINPAKIEQMYFPVFYGRNGMKQVVVE